MTDNDYLTDEERYQDEEYNPKGFRNFVLIVLLMFVIGFVILLALL
jgi:hypothetical protein